MAKQGLLLRLPFTANKTEKLVETFINRSPMKCPSDAILSFSISLHRVLMTAQTHIAHESL
jgi:hypothetical protein